MTPPPLTTRPAAVAIAGNLLLVRAALRVPMPVLVLIYVLTGVKHEGRWPNFPDGASDMFRSFGGADLENFVLWPLSWLAGPARDVFWLVAYATVTVGYVAVGLSLRRGRAMSTGRRRTVLTLITTDAVWRVLTMFALVPFAVYSLRTGENVQPGQTATILGTYYDNEHVIHVYEWLLAPWAVLTAGVAATVAIVLLKPSTRRHLARRSEHPTGPVPVTRPGA